MTYVSYLSARRTLRNFAIVLLIGFAIFAVSYARLLGEIHGNMHQGSGKDEGMIFTVIAAVAGFLGLIIATIRASTLDTLGRFPAVTFTRPESRISIALRNYGVDALTILAAAFMVVVFGAIVVTVVGVWPFIEGSRMILDTIETFAAVIVMWYGLVTMVSAFFPGRGGAISGASWAFALVAPTIASIPFPNPIHWLLHALLYFDPLMYAKGEGSHFTIGVSSDHALIADPTLRLTVATVIGIIALIVATRVWSTKDAVA